MVARRFGGSQPWFVHPRPCSFGRAQGWAHEPCQPGQGPCRGRRHVRRCRREVRRHERRAVDGDGPAVAAGDRPGRWGAGQARRVLDIAAGTGTSAEPFADAGVCTWCRPTSRWGCCGWASGAGPTWPSRPPTRLRLPFADESFDAVTMSFGLRNVVDTDAALREFLRVTRPGGRLVVCEFSQPVNAAFRAVYLNYLMRALPRIARHTSSTPSPTVYLAESIRAWPDQRELAGRVGGRRLGRRRVAQPHRRHRRPAPGRQARRADADGASPARLPAAAHEAMAAPVARRYPIDPAESRRSGFVDAEVWRRAAARAPPPRTSEHRDVTMATAATRRDESADVIVVGAGPAGSPPRHTWPWPASTSWCWRRPRSRARRSAATG